MRRPHAAAAALFLLAACTGSDAPPNAQAFHVDTVGGVPHAMNRGTPPAWRLEPERSVGARSSPEDTTAFGRVVGLALAPDGRLYVADQASDEVRAFNPDGSPAGTWGRTGGGPGEFDRLYDIAWLGDTLAVMDPGNARIGLLSPTGEWLGQHPFARISGDAGFVRFFAAGSDRPYHPAPSPEEPMAMGWAQPGADATPLTIPSPERRPSSVVCRGDGMLAVYGNPTAPRWITVPGPRRTVVSVWTADYRIAQLTAGDTMRVTTRSLAPRPVPDSTDDRIRKGYEAWHEQLGEVTCEPNRMTYFDHHPVVTAVTWDDRGRMWVEADGIDGASWDVYDGEGRLVGSLPAPPRLSSPMPSIRNGRMAVVEEDPSGAHRVVIYRIVEGGP